MAPRSSGSTEVQVGPDLNGSRSPLDKKLYRQILLPNGLRCALIQDTLAMHENKNVGEVYESDEEDNDKEEEGDDEEEEEDEGGLREAAVCVLVGVGSMYDPLECQGLAHFLEHLLFMGSEKYPGENDYDAFVSKHGGSDNAWTEWEYTTYNLSIPQAYLWPALDRLAQFFVAPLLLESAVDRELLSIESEFQLNRNSDSCRWEQLLSATSKPDHPMAKFSWGSLKSIREIPKQMGVDSLKELRKFYNQYYYAANMRLAVIGGYSLDVLQQKVCAIFSEVPALPRESPPLPLPVDPQQIGSWECEYTSPLAEAGMPWEASPQVYRILPIKERHTLSLTWPIPSQMDHWSSKPADYIAHLMGHEAAESLLSYFRSQAWAVSCVVGVGEDGSESASSHALFTASFVLSEEGLKSWRNMVDAVYQYIGMMRYYSQIGWPEWIYEELRTIHEVAYHYGDEDSPDDIVESIIEDMAPHFKLPPERLLDGSRLLFDFNPEAVDSILHYMTPMNARIDLTSSSFGEYADHDVSVPEGSTETIICNLKVLDECDEFDPSMVGPPQIEPMFGTLFWCHTVPTQWIEKWASLAQPQEPILPISLPSKNPFVPARYDLKPLPDGDAHHPLLNSSLKLCIVVGKTKQWFPATAIQYSRKNNALLLSYEDEEEQWHMLDQTTADLHSDVLTPDFEGTMDTKTIKYRIVALSQPGEGPVRKFGDDSDFDAEEGKGFPPIPPALSASRLPRQIANTNVLKMWHLQDRNFHRPIAELRLQIICAQANATPLHRACADLLVTLCADACLETSYLASVCELGSSIDSSDVGFVLRFHGFDDKLLDLFESMMTVILSFRGRKDSLPDAIDISRFDACLEVLRRKYKNNGMSSEKLSAILRLQALRPTIWSAHRKANSLSSLDIPQFAATIDSILDRFAIEALYHGNVDRSDANTAKDLILRMVEETGGSGLSRKNYPPQSVLRIPSGEKPMVIQTPSKNPSEPNTSVEVYIQVGKDNLRDRVLIELLIHMQDELFYAKVRTEDQYGYDVHCDLRWTYGICGMIFKVVTNVKSASNVVARVDQFFQEYREELESMSDIDFLEHVIGLANHKLDMFNNLSEETDTLWGEIRDGRFSWQVWRDETICLRSLTKEDALKAFDTWLNPVGRRNILAVQVIGNGEGDVSADRPRVSEDEIGDFLDAQVSGFHRSCKGQTWGRVNSKLF